MPNWAIYFTANNRVKDYLVSDPHDPIFPVNAGEAAIKDPNVTDILSVPVKYWKHQAGSIVEMSQGEKDTLDAEIAIALRDAIRLGGKQIVDSQSPVGIMERAFADIVKDEVNLLRQWLAAFKVEAAAATNLANFQARIATLPATPDRTLAQLKTAIQNRIDSGTVDS